MARVQAVPRSSVETQPGRQTLTDLLLRPAVLVGLIMLLGAALRIYRLGAQSLWVDEVITATAPSHRTFQDLISWTQWDNQMPLYNAITWGLARIGHGDAFLRLPSAVAGTLTIPVMYWLGRSTFGKRTGLVAALLMAVMPFAVWYSQEARPYAFLMLFTTLQMVFAFRAVRGPALLDWSGLAAATLLNLYTHYMAIAATFGVCAFICAALAYRGFRAVRRRDTPGARWQWVLTGAAGLATAGVVIIGYLPWARTLRNFLHRPTQGLGRFAGAPHSVTLGDVLGLLASFNLTGLVLALVGVGLIACVLWAFAGRVLETALPVICLVVPLVPLVLVLRSGLFVIEPRYLSFLFPSALLLAAVGVEAIALMTGAVAERYGAGLRRAAILVASLALVALLLLQLSPELSRAYGTAKDDYRGAALAIASASPPDSLVLAMGQYSNYITVGLGYYLQDRPSPINLVESKAIDDHVINQLAGSHGTVWAALTRHATDLERVSTSGYEVKRFVGVTLVRLPASSLPPLAQAESLLRWGTGFEPELAASIDLLHVFRGDRSPVKEAITTTGHWALGPGATASNGSVLLAPGGATANATFSLRNVMGGQTFAVVFRYRNAELQGEQRVFVSAHDRSGQYLAVFPAGDGYLCSRATNDSEGAFAFAVPDGTDSIVVWLRASGGGHADFGPIDLYRMN